MSALPVGIINLISPLFSLHTIFLKTDMGLQQLKSKHLAQMGFPKGSIAGQVLQLLHTHYRRASDSDVMDLLTRLSSHPEDFVLDPVWSAIATQIVPPPTPQPVERYRLRDTPAPSEIFGGKLVGESARTQMELALRLPVAVQGALMPDAHKGYGLPVGGVLATKGAVIPYAVGVDIGCRMCLSILDLPAHRLEGKRQRFIEVLTENTRFGMGYFKTPSDHPILDRSEFKDIPLLHALKDTAWRQLGSSGGGNHFVEFGIVDIPADQPDLGVQAGAYVGLLSHSGSRSLGAQIAEHFSDLARQQVKLPHDARHLAWLDLDTEEGQAYWLAMNLAGDYAAACHHDIHRRVLKAMGGSVQAVVENHHNFAWLEKQPDGSEWVVHRKGATPAGPGVYGIIPGSMTLPAFVVRGLGNPRSLQSAAHGAGRQLSRMAAQNSITRAAMRKDLEAYNVSLIGGDIDEAPAAYKDIHTVMTAHLGLIETIATFAPKVVRMDTKQRKR